VLHRRDPDAKSYGKTYVFSGELGLLPKRNKLCFPTLY